MKRLVLRFTVGIDSDCRDAPLRFAQGRGADEASAPQKTKIHSNSSITISGFDPKRRGGPHVPAPLDVNTCIRPIRLKP
jgi:hypothetical protein